MGCWSVGLLLAEKKTRSELRVDGNSTVWILSAHHRSTLRLSYSHPMDELALRGSLYGNPLVRLSNDFLGQFMNDEI